MAAERLTQEQVLHLAKLARLELTPEEVERYTRELGDVLEYVAKVQELKARMGADTRSAAVLREDVVQPRPDAAQLIAEAPVHTDTHIEVPAVFDDR